MLSSALGCPERSKRFFSLIIVISLAGILSGCAGLVHSSSTGGGNPTPVSIATTTLPGATAQASYAAMLAATGGTAPYQWSVVSGTLPAGLSLAASSGQISGTPTQTGTASFSVQVVDSSATPQKATQTLTITVAAKSISVSITTSTLPSGQQGTAYTTSLTASGGTTPYAWSVSAGSLPTGLTLAASTGVISGTPTAAGTSSFIIMVKDSTTPTAQTATQSLSISVSASVASLSITTNSLANGTQGSVYSATLAATGGTAPYTWSISSGVLPAGLSLNASTGQISGTPTGSGSFTFTAKVTDSTTATAQAATKALSITIASSVTAVSITTASLPAGSQGVAYSATLAAAGGTTPYTWSISSGSLPTGLSLSSASGAISGTPTTSGTFTFTANVVDSTTPTAQSAAGTFSISVGAVTSNSPVISPSVPVVNQGSSVTFTCILNCGTGGTWSCANCAGSIVPSTGIYTAPATVMPQQMSGGYQLLPNNHIYNVNVSSLPVTSGSSGMLAQFSGSVFFQVAWPPNYVTNSTPTINESFWYINQPGSQYNGLFSVPAAPFVGIESGWLQAQAYAGFNASLYPFNHDHHFVSVNTQNGVVEEMYQLYPAGTEVTFGVDSCSSCTSRQGVKYNYSDYALPGYYTDGTLAGATDAAGLQIWPLTLRLQEVEQAAAGCPTTPGVVHHALRFTSALGPLATTVLWPATTPAGSGGGTNPYGERLRLKSSFNISGYSCIAQVVLKTLQQYGMFLADVGTDFAQQVEYTRWPYAYSQALGAIQNANIGSSNFEIVDESSLEVNAQSGLANTGRETVTYTASTGTAMVDVALMGVAVNVAKDIIYVQAGTPQMQLAGFSNLGGLTWTMSPSVGTLTSSGLYTAPASATTPSSTTVTATSTVNSAISGTMTLVVLPSNGIYLLPGQTTNYTDSHGNVWLAGPLYGGSDAANGFSTMSAFGYDNGGSWLNTTDITLYKIPIYAANDLRFDIYVPNGTYTIDAKFANNSGSSQGNFVIEVQGIAQPSPVDIYSLVGSNLPYDYTTTVTVTNGILSFVLRTINTTGNGVAPFISALQITP